MDVHDETYPSSIAGRSESMESTVEERGMEGWKWSYARAAASSDAEEIGSGGRCGCCTSSMSAVSVNEGAIPAIPANVQR